jgi:hypothetical protein
VEHNQPGLYKNIDTTIPALPPRSILYSIEPMGIGTPYVESLASYINRLAVEHSISVADLFTKIIMVRYGNDYFSKSNTLGYLWKMLGAINNVSETNANIARIMSELTARPDLKYLTLACLEGLNTNGISAKIKRYCPKCYEERKTIGSTIYDPLIWNFNLIRICPIHRTYLVDKCTNENCTGNFTILKNYSMLGYCPLCHRWLGFQPTDTIDTGTIESQEWITKQLCDLVTEIPTLSETDIHSNIRKALKCILEVYGKGTVTKLSETTGICYVNLKDWFGKQKCPSLISLIKICFRLNVSLISILKYGALKEFPISNGNAYLEIKERICKNYRVDKDLIKNKLKEMIDENNKNNPLSVSKAARIIGVSTATLYNHFPEICNYIVNERRAFFSRKKKERTEELCRAVKEGMINIYNSGQYPSKGRLGKILGFYVFFISEVEKTWEKTIKELGLEILD